MLRSIDRENAQHTVFRLSVLLDDKNILGDADASGDDASAIKDMIDDKDKFLKGFNQQERLREKYIDSVFNPKRYLAKKLPTRFSDERPVFYSSLDEKTAEAEVCYHHCKLISDGEEIQDPAHRVLLSCTFAGPVKDLRSLACPKLTQDADVKDGYKFCQQLGKEAIDEGLYGLLAPSARRRDGTNLPVFRKQALSDIELRHCVEIFYDPIEKSAQAIKIDHPGVGN